MSSAYITSLDPTDRLLMSLTYIQHNKGPGIEPYDTPDMIGRAVDVSPFRTRL